MKRDDLRIDSDTLLPDLFEHHPETRRVFDQYGLKGCGGRRGPFETIRFFSRTHGVDEEMLLQQIKQSVRGDFADSQSPTLPGVADTIYRRFFAAGILLVLTLGATWGAWLLWQIGVSGSFTSASIHQVNAHGHAQIFGWVGLFIMGFAYQAFPRMWHRELVAPRMAAATFLMMLVGIIIRTAGMALTESVGWAVPVVLAGGILQILAILIFVAQILVTFRSSGTRWEPYLGFITAALVWFVIMSVFSLWHTLNTMTANSKGDLLFFVSTYQAPLRDIQIHGLALFMILGVSIRMLPALFDLAPVPAGRAWKALAILVLALLGEVFFFVLFHTTGNVIWAFALLGAWVLLAAGVLMIVLRWKLWRPFAVRDRSGKFVRSAYLWSAISLAMLILMPVYLRLSGTVFSHAYYGAARHAITVGFISLMIMGIAAKVVPTLNGVDISRLSSLWGPFLLVNVGCFLRVTTQMLTDWNPWFFALIGFSGLLEVTGLAWWGVGLIGVMIQGKKQELSDADRNAGEKPLQISPDLRVADVLEWFPQTEPIFLKHGFTAIRQPVLRRTLARQVSLAQAASLRGVSLDSFLNDLNRAAGCDRLPVI